MGLIDSYKCWRHGHGFGVHSPFAYRMVREVLRPGRVYAYYAYKSLPAGELRLLYRIMVALQPASVCVCASGVRREALERLAALAVPSAVPVDGAQADMVIVDRDADARIDGARYVYFNNPEHEALAALCGAMTCGHVYRNRRRALAVLDPGLPCQIFDISY